MAHVERSRLEGRMAVEEEDEGGSLIEKKMENIDYQHNAMHAVKQVDLYTLVLFFFSATTTNDADIAYRYVHVENPTAPCNPIFLHYR